MFQIRPNTKVLLPDGTSIPIAQVRLGMELQGREGSNKVVGLYTGAHYGSLWELNDDIVGVDSGQPFMTEDGWAAIDQKKSMQDRRDLEVRALTQGMQFYTNAGNIEAGYLKTVPNEKGSMCVEIELDGDHTYYVNGYLVHNKGGGSTSGTSTTVTKTDPPAYLEPYLTDIASKAQSAYQQVPQGGYSGQLIATPTANQQAALAQQAQVANNLGPNFGAQTTAIADQQANKILSGSYTNPANNQFQQTNLATRPAVDAYLQPVLDNLQNKVIPGVQSNAINQGAYGGSRYGVELGQQINDNFTTQANNIAAQMGYGEQVRMDEQRFNNFTNNQNLIPQLQQTELAAQIANSGIANAGVQQQLTPSSILSQVGGAEQLQQQDLLDEAYQQYLLAIQGPFAGLDQYAGLISGTGYGGTSTGTSNVPKSSGGSNFLSGALGGAASGAALGSVFPGVGTVFGGLGGAILGGLGGSFF